MTALEKRQLAKALKAVRGNLEDIATYLSRPYLSLDDLREMYDWASECHDDLVKGVIGAREDGRIDWQTFASLVWARNDVARVCEALHCCLSEPRAD